MQTAGDWRASVPHLLRRNEFPDQGPTRGRDTEVRARCVSHMSPRNSSGLKPRWHVRLEYQRRPPLPTSPAPPTTRSAERRLREYRVLRIVPRRIFRRQSIHIAQATPRPMLGRRADRAIESARIGRARLASSKLLLRPGANFKKGVSRRCAVAFSRICVCSLRTPRLRDRRPPGVVNARRPEAAGEFGALAQRRRPLPLH